MGGWTGQWAAVGEWLGCGGSASVQDVVYDAGGCCGVMAVGCIVGGHVHVGSGKLVGGYRGVAQLVGCSWCCRSGGLCRPNNGGKYISMVAWDRGRRDLLVRAG